ncbi:MAG: hypothetical protein DA405_02075 [Bacteroidetes bacterium]|nr:MAG: hypothetical protein DA405_02075 [Bacteroidota bacterium]
MKLIPVLLNSSETNYRSKLSEELIMNKIAALKEQASLRLKGSITSEHRFSVYDTWNVVAWNMPGFKRKAAYITGSITAEDEGQRISLKVKPNAILPVFGIVSSLAGLILTLISFTSGRESVFLFSIGLCFLVLGFIYYLLGRFLRSRLLNKLIKYLDLKLD